MYLELLGIIYEINNLVKSLTGDYLIMSFSGLTRESRPPFLPEILRPPRRTQNDIMVGLDYRSRIDYGTSFAGMTVWKCRIPIFTGMTEWKGGDDGESGKR